jgi:hypothetical protein
MTPDEQDEKFTAACADALQQATDAGYPGAVILKWLVVAEVLDQDDRAMLIAIQPDMRQWDTLGMLDFLRAREHANVTPDD